MWIAIIIILIIVLIAAAAARCRYELRTLSVSRYELSSDKINEGDSLRAVFIADLHSCEYGDNNEELIKLIIDEAPDVILIGGDMIVSRDGRRDNITRSFITRIMNEVSSPDPADGRRVPVFYAPGNHEKAVESLRQFRTRNRNYMSFLKSEGVTYLRNTSADINGSVSVTGLDVGYEYYNKVRPVRMTSETMASYLGKTDTNRYNIILAHNPRFFNEYAESGADLVLSGHYHGGSIRLPLIGGVISPQFRLFPAHSKGKYTKNGMTMIVTGGCGSHTVNLRLFNKPEIVVISLTGTGE